MLYLHDLLYCLPDQACRLLLKTKFTRIWVPFSQDERYLFIHIPKAAGTHVSAALYPCFVNHYPLKLYRLSQPERVARMWSFAIVRDPALRFLSAIHHHLTGEDDLSPASCEKKAMLKISSDPFVVAQRFFDDPVLRFRLRGSLLFVPQWLWVSHHGKLVPDVLYKLAPTREYVDKLTDKVRSNVSEHMTERSQMPPALIEQIERYYAVDCALYGSIPQSRLLHDASELTRERLSKDEAILARARKDTQSLLPDMANL